MGHYGDAYIDNVMARVGVPVSVIRNGEEFMAKGVEDVVDEEMLQSESATFIGTRNVLVMKHDALPDLAEGDTIEVSGEQRRVLSVRRLDDGALIRVFCAKL